VAKCNAFGLKEQLPRGWGDQAPARRSRKSRADRDRPECRPETLMVKVGMINKDGEKSLDSTDPGADLDVAAIRASLRIIQNTGPRSGTHFPGEERTFVEPKENRIRCNNSMRAYLLIAAEHHAIIGTGGSERCGHG